MQTFAIAPAGARPLWVLVPVVLTLAVALVAIVVTVLGARHARFDVSPAGIRLTGDWYGRFVPASALVVERARRVDLASAAELRPRRRTLGTGMPGYQAGWFRLANGGRALVYLTDRSKTVYLPTTLGYDLLLSPEDPDAFLAAVRAAAGRS